MAIDLDAIKPFLHYDYLAIVGGEPLLSPNIPEFIQLAMASGVVDDVMVITNGTLLPKQADRFWESLKALRISIYPILDRAIIALAQEKSEKHGFRLELMECTEFYKQFKQVPDDGMEVFQNCTWKDTCHTIHDGRYYRCPQSVFFHKVFSQLNEGEDGLELTGLTDEKLSAFLDRTEPLKACSVCCGGHSETVPWREAKTKKEWMEGSTVERGDT